jgi:hypothetical protein
MVFHKNQPIKKRFEIFKPIKITFSLENKLITTTTSFWFLKFAN